MFKDWNWRNSIPYANFGRVYAFFRSYEGITFPKGDGQHGSVW